jgi:hypothetical protein
MAGALSMLAGGLDEWGKNTAAKNLAAINAKRASYGGAPVAGSPVPSAGAYVGGGVQAGGGIGIGGGGVGSSTRIDPNAIYQSWQSQMDAANKANESRYQDILGGYGQRYNDVMGMLEGQGQMALSDAQSQGRAREAAVGADMSMRGLGTIVPTMQMGIARDTAAEQRRINEGIRGQKASNMTGLSGDKLAFMERKNEIGPDYGQMLDLIKGVGSGQGGLDAYNGFQAGAGAGGQGWQPTAEGGMVLGRPEVNQTINPQLGYATGGARKTYNWKNNQTGTEAPTKATGLGSSNQKWWDAMGSKLYGQSF